MQALLLRAKKYAPTSRWGIGYGDSLARHCSERNIEVLVLKLVLTSVDVEFEQSVNKQLQKLVDSTIRVVMTVVHRRHVSSVLSTA